MIKKYNQFLNENKQVPGPNTPGSLKLDINETEAELFSNEPELGELIADQKVSLLTPHLWYMENDSDTIKVLNNYFDLDKVEEEEFNESVDANSKKELEELAKRIKELQKEYDKMAKEVGTEKEKKKVDKFNQFVKENIELSNSSDEDEIEINEKQIDEFLDNGVNVNVFLTDLLSETNLILLMSNDELYEREAGSKSWTKYSSKEEFKSKTGASLDEEYAGNESPALLNLFDEVDDRRKYYIEKAYIDHLDPLLDSILKSFE